MENHFDAGKQRFDRIVVPDVKLVKLDGPVEISEVLFLTGEQTVDDDNTLDALSQQPSDQCGSDESGSPRY
jgi:hypothetical protein